MYPQTPQRAATSVPPKKPRDQHKGPISLTLEPENLDELGSYEEYGYRSRSHMVDDALKELIERKKREKSGPSEVASR